MSTTGSKQSADKFEMSRYIDLDLYHSVERSHPYYKEMTTEMLKELHLFYEKDQTKKNVLEFGAGTGLFTADLKHLDFIHIDALEIDQNCLEILKNHIGNGVNFIHDNAITYYKQNYYDVVISTFAHDHIPYHEQERFIKNLHRNLKKGGLYIMGGEILPFYTTDAERTEALHLYHGFIINKALREGHYALAQIEINALQSGIEMTGDFKRHEKMFEDEMRLAPFHLLHKIKLGPEQPDHVGGVFVYVYQSL